MRSFLEHDGLQEVHSFEKAWTIRDAEGNEVEWGEGGDDEAGAGGLGRWPARRGNEYLLRGAYRRLMVRPSGWEHRQVPYRGEARLQSLRSVDRHGLLRENERELGQSGKPLHWNGRQPHQATDSGESGDGDEDGKEDEAEGDSEEEGARSKRQRLAEPEGQAGQDDPEKRGLVCEFSLPPGAYATMLFRELQKDGRGPRQPLPQHVRFE